VGEASNGVKVLGPTLEGGAPSEGAVGPEGPDSAEVVAERLERKAESIRDELTDLVGELDHRRRAVGPRLRLLKPLVKPLAVVAGVGLVVGAARVWRRSRRARRRTGRTRRAGAR
jgi:hypothetical protein